MSLPTFMTARLHLKPLEYADEAALLELTSDPEVMRFVSDDRPMNLERTRVFLSRALEDHAAVDYGAMAVVKRDTLE